MKTLHETRVLPTLTRDERGVLMGALVHFAGSAHPGVDDTTLPFFTVSIARKSLAKAIRAKALTAAGARIARSVLAKLPQ